MACFHLKKQQQILHKLCKYAYMQIFLLYFIVFILMYFIVFIVFCFFLEEFISEVYEIS